MIRVYDLWDIQKNLIWWNVLKCTDFCVGLWSFIEGYYSICYSAVDTCIKTLRKTKIYIFYNIKNFNTPYKYKINTHIKSDHADQLWKTIYIYIYMINRKCRKRHFEFCLLFVGCGCVPVNKEEHKDNWHFYVPLVIVKYLYV